MSKQDLKPYIKRLGLVLIVSLVMVIVISEVGIRLQRENTARAPQTIELAIPSGTAKKIETGEVPPGIPSDLTFVLGDILLVQNFDSVAHTLGPLLIPAGTSAQMPLEQAENLALACSFTPSNYLGIEVHTPTTLNTRLTALSFAVPPTAVILFVYSLVGFPLSGKEDDPQ
jgi:hypothetical protein